MARKGYFGRNFPGLTISDIPRQTGLGSHVASVKRQNIRMDAATIVARHRDFLTPDTTVGLAKAEDQNFQKPTGGPHEAHEIKRFTFGGKKTILDVYMRPGVDEVAILGLGTMFGLVTAVHPRANLSIDKRLENNPQRLEQLQLVVDSSIGSLAEARALARELEFRRRFFEKDLLRHMQGGFEGDAEYQAMRSVYGDSFSAAPVRRDARPYGGHDRQHARRLESAHALYVFVLTHDPVQKVCNFLGSCSSLARPERPG